MNVGKDYKDRLPTEEQTRKSLSRYFGFKHSKINTLASSDFSRITEMQSKGWLLESSKEEIGQLIEDFVNIYGYIYKNGNDSGYNRLIRGTTINETNNLREGSEIESALSTTTDEGIAKQFCEYGKAALVRVKATEGLPCLYVEDLKDENVASEKEVLILPFSRVKKIENTSNWQGYKYYDVILEKGELPEISQGRLDELKKSCISGYDEFSKQLKEYGKLRDYYEAIYNRNDFSYEAKYKVYEDIKKIEESITTYKNNLQQLLKGLCRQRKKDIDYEIGAEARKEFEERNKRETERQRQLKSEVQNLKQNLGKSAEIIENGVQTNIGKLVKNIKWFRNASKTLGINTFNSQDLEGDLLQRVNNISEGLQEEVIAEDKDKEYGIVAEKISKYDYAKDLLQEMPELLQSYNENSTIDLKNNLNEKVQGIIFETVCNNINNQKKILLSQKDTFLNRILGKTALKQAKLNNLDAKMNSEVENIKDNNPSNSVSKMLANMYECAYNYNGGNLTQKMQETEEAIRKVFNNLPSKEDLIENSNYSQVKDLMNVERKKGLFSFIGNIQEAKRLKEETSQLENNTEKKKKSSIKNTNIAINGSAKLTSIYSKFNNVLDRVCSFVREDSNNQEVILDQEYYQE